MFQALHRSPLSLLALLANHIFCATLFRSLLAVSLCGVEAEDDDHSERVGGRKKRGTLREPMAQKMKN